MNAHLRKLVEERAAEHAGYKAGQEFRRREIVAKLESGEASHLSHEEARFLRLHFPYFASAMPRQWAPISRVMGLAAMGVAAYAGKGLLRKRS